MERFIKGDIVVMPFPFSDLSQSKKRPAFVLADLHGDDLILCQITSRNIDWTKFREEFDRERVINIINYVGFCRRIYEQI